MFEFKSGWRYRTYRFELRPNGDQVRAFHAASAARRFAYNFALERWRAYYLSWWDGSTPPPSGARRVDG
jgi:hypothetical protein